MITLVPITDAAHLVHGPSGCAGNSWNTRGSLSSGPTLYRRGFTTDLTEREVVAGGEQRLADAITTIASRHNPAAIFVYTTCVPAMTGDDVPAVCASAQRLVGIPVIPVPAPGFSGSKNHGTNLAGQVLLDRVIGTMEPDRRTPLDVNLIGEYNIAGELWNVLPVLRRLGLRVLSPITGDARYREIAVAHRARATMVVCSRALLSLAEGLRDQYGIPWFEGSWYGLSGMRSAIRGFAGVLIDADPWLSARAEAVIAESEAAVEPTLAAYRKRLAGKRAVLYTGGVKSWSLVAALRDLGVEVVASGATKSTPEDVERMRQLLGSGGQVISQTSPAALLRVIRETGADLLLAGGRNQYTAVKARLPFVDVNQERHKGYTGYSGLVELARELDQALHNPVWDVVTSPAPWRATPTLAGVR
jgi:nitrogenase molybdenum-cofactor synthesis protein NifE